MDPPITWLCMTCGALIGGLAIRFVGFRDTDSRKKRFTKFLTTCFWLQNGITVTTITTYLLKLSDLSVYLESRQSLSFVLSVVGLIKFYPPATLSVPFSGGSFLDSFRWIFFWQLPSIYFCTFNCDTLLQSTKISFFLLLTCVTAGAIAPLRGAIIEDLGIKIVKCSIPCFIFGLTLKLVMKPFGDEYSLLNLINSTFIVIISGLLIDDVQQIKKQYELQDEVSEPEISINNKAMLRKSVPLFLEFTMIFGRIVAIIGSSSSPKELEE